MKKEWILSDEEKQQKRAKIEENRAKKRTPSSNPASNNHSANSAVNSPQGWIRLSSLFEFGFGPDFCKICN